MTYCGKLLYLIVKWEKKLEVRKCNALRCAGSKKLGKKLKPDSPCRRCTDGYQTEQASWLQRNTENNTSAQGLL